MSVVRNQTTWSLVSFTAPFHSVLNPLLRQPLWARRTWCKNKRRLGTHAHCLRNSGQKRKHGILCDLLHHSRLNVEFWFFLIHDKKPWQNVWQKFPQNFLKGGGTWSKGATKSWGKSQVTESLMQKQAPIRHPCTHWHLHNSGRKRKHGILCDLLHHSGLNVEFWLFLIYDKKLWQNVWQKMFKILDKSPGVKSFGSYASKE